MTGQLDLDQQLSAFLREGPTDLPDPSFDAVRDRIEQTRQRAVIGFRGVPDMNKFLAAGLGAAAVMIIAVVGYQFLGNSNTGSPGAAQTPQPTATTPVTPEPSSMPGGVLPGGSHLLWDPSFGGGPFFVTISAPGWYGEPGGGILQKNGNFDAPDGAGLIIFAGPTRILSQDHYVYGDPCHWETTKPDAPVTTVDEAVTALASQASRDASAPVDINVGGRAGKSITLHVPDNAVFSDCDQGEFRTLIQEFSDGSGGEARYAQSPGQIEKLWVLDVNGLVIIAAGYYEGTPQSVIDELDAIVESLDRPGAPPADP